MAIFNIGDKVTWTSQSRSCEKTKTGTVVMTREKALANFAHMNANRPARVADAVFPVHRRMFDGLSWTNAGVLVEVIDTKRGKPKLYMPHAKNLKGVM